MFYKKTCIALLVIMFAVCTFAEKVKLESIAGNLDSLTIGMMPFISIGSKTEILLEPDLVIADDLNFSGRFSVIRSDKPDAAMFKQQNISLYIDGSYRVNGETITLYCYLRETASGQELAGKKYEGSFATLRSMEHSFSNEIQQMLFNEKGDCDSRILFVKDNSPVKQIMVMDYDGFNQRQLTFNSSMNIFPAAADATSFVCTTFIHGHADICRGNINGGGRLTILSSSRATQTSPSVSPIDGKIVFASSRSGNMDIYVCDAYGGNLKQLTFNSSIETAPCWSPNGAQIAFTSDRGGSPQIYVMDADGANAHRITYEGYYQDSPAWSPKGDRIAYMSMNGGEFSIWTVQTDGSNPQKLTTNPGSNEYPSWSPNGRHIVFSCKNGKSTNLYAILADGSHLRKLTNTGNAKMPDWSPY